MYGILFLYDLLCRLGKVHKTNPCTPELISAKSSLNSLCQLGDECHILGFFVKSLTPAILAYDFISMCSRSYIKLFLNSVQRQIRLMTGVQRHSEPHCPFSLRSDRMCKMWKHGSPTVSSFPLCSYEAVSYYP